MSSNETWKQVYYAAASLAVAKVLPDKRSDALSALYNLGISNVDDTSNGLEHLTNAYSRFRPIILCGWFAMTLAMVTNGRPRTRWSADESLRVLVEGYLQPNLAEVIGTSAAVMTVSQIDVPDFGGPAWVTRVEEAIGAHLEKIPSKDHNVDVLLITAMKDEYDQVLRVTDGLSPAGWRVSDDGPQGYRVAHGTFETPTGSLVVVTSWANHTGREQAQATASLLIQHYKPRCIAMSGICAGRRGDVALGDVIFGDRLWSYDAGKRKVTPQDDGTHREVFQGDHLQFRLSAAWKQRVESFQVDAAAKWLAERPTPPLENQEWWLLLALLRGEDPRNHPNRPDLCPDWSIVLMRLRRKGLLTASGLDLTEKGRHEAEEFDLLHIDGIPAPAPFRVHVAPIATGAEVTEDAGIFPRLAKSMRKVLGVEMEASAIGAIGEIHDIPALVAKGVSDFGDEFKDDRYRRFAARASAECLLSVLRDGADLIRLAAPLARPVQDSLLTAPFAGRIVEEVED